MEKKLDDNYTRMLRAILNKSWTQHPTKLQLWSHLLSIAKTIKVRRNRHTGHCWRSKDELISDVLLWTLSHGRAKSGRPARTYIQQLCADVGCSPEDQQESMDDREGWREKVRDIRDDGVTWWYIYISIYIYNFHFYIYSIILTVWKKQIIQFVNKRILHKMIYGKKGIYIYIYIYIYIISISISIL